jgi:hypothetical protein
MTPRPDTSDEIKNEDDEIIPNAPEVIRGTKDAMLFALERTRGIVSPACRHAGISRDTHYRWLREDEQYLENVEDMKNVAHDFVESKLLQLINGVAVMGSDGKTIYQRPPDNASVIFYLKTQCKHRGYIERADIGIIANEIVVEIDGVVMESRPLNES